MYRRSQAPQQRRQIPLVPYVHFAKRDHHRKTKTQNVDLQVVLTRFDGSRSKGGLEEFDMRIFMNLDLLKPSSNPRKKSSVFESRLGVGVKILGVKSGLEIFKSQSKVQDLSVWMISRSNLR